MKESLATISKRTGFSITTISRVLSGKAEKYRISKETARAVLKEANRCNYRPSSIAQSLRTSTTKTIGLLLPSLANPYFAEMAGIIISEVRKKDYNTIVLDTMESGELLRSGVSDMLGRGVDAMIVVPCGNDCRFLEELESDGIPVVLIDRYYEGTPLSFVTTNNYMGGKEATAMLISNGHKRIACIQGVVTSMPNRERVQGFRDAMAEAGLSPEAIVTGGDYTVQNGYLETKLLLCRSPRPTAIFALSNTIGLGVIKAIHEASLKIPEDISLISFDNNVFLDYMVPAITRVGQPVDDMATLATKIIFDKLELNNVGNSQLRLLPSLITRESVNRLVE